MNERDPITGLPKEISSFEEIVKEQQKVSITIDKRRYGKMMTIVDGINPHEIDINELTTKLKSKCACGGTVKEGRIELQGDHRNKVKETLENIGFVVEVAS
ncbi:translation initiation factor 1 (eIF-1/SUI1) [Thermoplasmatales archaeon SCGC AB-539-N05]|nr:translation initiation factor 1 (eIF-1/SUI1) [Thermoplasmatales archaeon SCGC AB-539-N05]ENO12174.1 translation initiation factor 1 (eIF-1/SUI1) [Thermoplasmatales archaeon SCGC AB-539-C06]